jgi:Helix-turn-helix domain
MVALRTLMGGKPTTESERCNEHLSQLLAQLKIAYRQAGEPSYRTIAMLAGKRLSASTISRIFNASKPPKWHNLATLLNALGVQPHDLATVWHPLWAKALNKVNPITDVANAAQEPLSPALQDKNCAECGASVANPAVHAKWHERLSRAEELLEALERYSKRPVSQAPLTTRQPRGHTQERRTSTDKAGRKREPRPQ